MTTASQKRGMARQQVVAANVRPQTGGGMRTVHNGVFATIHSDAPPPVEEYEAWLSEQKTGRNGRGRRATMTGAKLRRIVTMRRNGCGQSEIAASVGFSACIVGSWLARLPEGLRA